jgi:hypothetical protein
MQETLIRRLKSKTKDDLLEVIQSLADDLSFQHRGHLMFVEGGYVDTSAHNFVARVIAVDLVDRTPDA